MKFEFPNQIIVKTNPQQFVSMHLCECTEHQDKMKELETLQSALPHKKVTELCLMGTES